MKTQPITRARFWVWEYSDGGAEIVAYTETLDVAVMTVEGFHWLYAGTEFGFLKHRIIDTQRGKSINGN